MSKKKSRITEVKNKLITTVDNTKNTAKKVNGFALKTTEEVVLESVTIAEQWQKVTTKAIKGGFKLVANQQDIIFDTLDIFKAHYMHGKKRFSKVFA